jgi:hypothetical protein
MPAELAEAAEVSMMSALRFVRQLRKKGFLDAAPGSSKSGGYLKTGRKAGKGDRSTIVFWGGVYPSG